LTDVNDTVVDALVAEAMEAVPVVIVQVPKEYPVLGIAVIVVAAPKGTVIGELVGADIVPPVPVDIVNWHKIGVKFARTVALPAVSITAVEALVAEVMVAVPEVIVQFTKLYPVFVEAVMVVETP
jgi:hypothetical protein